MVPHGPMISDFQWTPVTAGELSCWINHWKLADGGESAMRMKTDRDQKGAIATNNVVNLSDKRNKGRRRVLFLSGTACLILIMFLFAVGFLHDRQKPALPFELSAMYRQFFSSSLPISNVKRGPIPICSGGNRAGRRVSCLVDGDTGW